MIGNCLKVRKIFKDRIFNQPYEPTPEEVTTAIRGAYNNPDLMMDLLMAGEYTRERPLDCGFSLIWTEKVSVNKEVVLKNDFSNQN